MLTSALEHYSRQQRITVAGLQAARRAKSQGPATVARVLTAYQLLAARDAVDAVPLMLAEQDIPDDPVGVVNYGTLSGTASDGRGLDTLFAQAETDMQFDMMVATQLQDVARIAAGIAIAMRPTVTGYVRMLNPPSCSRCAILAGKFFKWNKGFERHPRCDCRHVPSSEALAGDLTTDPKAYFDSLGPEDQARIFGKANSAAIRDGADMAQVVNTGRKMTVAGGRYIRGTGDGQIGPAPKGGPDLLGFLRESRPTTSLGRMTPEGIYAVAKDRAEAIALLRVHGYIT